MLIKFNYLQRISSSANDKSLVLYIHSHDMQLIKANQCEVYVIEEICNSWKKSNQKNGTKLFQVISSVLIVLMF